jgi:hypothetical protein
MEREAKNAQIGIDRIRAVMHHFRSEHGRRKSIPPSRKLWTALHALDGYLTGQSDRLVNYAERHRAGLRVGNATTEGIGNFSGDSPDEQISTTALVAARGRFSATGSRRCLQRHV